MLGFCHFSQCFWLILVGPCMLTTAVHTQRFILFVQVQQDAGRSSCLWLCVPIFTFRSGLCPDQINQARICVHINCWDSGFCHLRVSPPFQWCLQKKDRSWPQNVLLSAMVTVPCPGSQGSQCSLSATGLPPAVIAASLFCHTPSPWKCHFKYSILVKINFII